MRETKAQYENCFIDGLKGESGISYISLRAFRSDSFYLADGALTYWFLLFAWTAARLKRTDPTMVRRLSFYFGMRLVLYSILV